MSKRDTRVVYCGNSFLHFLLYYFSNSIKYDELAPYHYDWIDAFENGYHIYVEGHRECAKTTILGIAGRIYNICYRRYRFMCNVANDKRKSVAFNKQIIQELLSNEKLKADFGVLYSRTKNGESDEIEDKSAGDFVSNGCRVKAFGMGENIRGEIYNTKDRGIIRPDALYMDDIDNDKNTKNKRLIDEDMFFIQNEIFGGFSGKYQYICVGNVIRADGRNPRIRETYRNSKRWKIFQNFVYGPPGIDKGTPVWSRFVNTDEEAKAINSQLTNPDKFVISLEQKKDEEKSAYSQNWLGIPKQKGEGFIEPDWLRKIKKENLPKFDFIEMGQDPAFSLKTTSDCYGIVITGFVKTETGRYRKYVLHSKKLEGVHKKQSNVEAVSLQLYTRYGVRMVKVENNNGGGVFAKGIQARGMATKVLNSSRDKLSRMKEYESDLADGYVYFVEGETEELIEQLIEFTGEDGNEDDLADAMVASFHPGDGWAYITI